MKSDGLKYNPRIITKEERQQWVNRWNTLKPSKTRDLTVKMWGGTPKQNDKK